MIKIGIAINEILRNAEAFTEIVQPDNIFPSVAPDWLNDSSVYFPFVVYERDKIAPNYAKHSLEHGETFFSIHIFSKTYAQAVEIAQVVREKLELLRGTFAGVEINEIRLKDVNETFLEGVFIQKLDFTAKGGNTKDTVIYVPKDVRINTSNPTIRTNQDGQIIQTIHFFEGSNKTIENRFEYRENELLAIEQKNEFSQTAQRLEFANGLPTPSQTIAYDFNLYTFSILL